MIAKHTPEPWEMMKSGKENCFYLHETITDDKSEARGWRIADVVAGNEEANARRIVACVNSCASIPTDALEAGVVMEMVEALQSIATIVLRPFPAPEAEARRVNEAVETALNVLAKAKRESP